MVRSYQGLGTPVAAMVGCARLRTLMGSLPLNSKMGTSIVLRGKMGTGKTKVGEVFGWMYHRRRRSDHRDIPYAAADRVRRQTRNSTRSRNCRRELRRCGERSFQF